MILFLSWSTSVCVLCAWLSVPFRLAYVQSQAWAWKALGQSQLQVGLVALPSSCLCFLGQQYNSCSFAQVILAVDLCPESLLLNIVVVSGIEIHGWPRWEHFLFFSVCCCMCSGKDVFTPKFLVLRPFPSITSMNHVTNASLLNLWGSYLDPWLKPSLSVIFFNDQLLRTTPQWYPLFELML